MSLTPAKMSGFAEYALDRVYNLNVRTPENLLFEMSYNSLAVTVRLFIFPDDSNGKPSTDYAATYMCDKDNSAVYNKIKSWEEKYLKETPEDDKLG